MVCSRTIGDDHKSGYAFYGGRLSFRNMSLEDDDSIQSPLVKRSDFTKFDGLDLGKRSKQRPVSVALRVPKHTH